MIDFKTDVPTNARRLKGAIGLAPRAGAAVEIHQRHFRQRLQVHPLAAGQRMLRRHQRHQRLIGQLPVRHRQQIGIARPDADERHIAFLLAHVFQQRFAHADVQADIHRRIVAMKLVEPFGQSHHVYR